MKKYIALLTSFILSVSIMTSCGSSSDDNNNERDSAEIIAEIESEENDESNKFIGSYAGSLGYTLDINIDGTCRYYSEKKDHNGSWYIENGEIVLDFSPEMYVIYGKFESDTELYVYSYDSHWLAETFSKKIH